MLRTQEFRTWPVRVWLFFAIVNMLKTQTEKVQQSPVIVPAHARSGVGPPRPNVSIVWRLPEASNESDLIGSAQHGSLPCC